MHDFVFFISLALVKVELIADDDQPMLFKVIILALQVAVALRRYEVFVALRDVTEAFNDIILVVLLNRVDRTAFVSKLDRSRSACLLADILAGAISVEPRMVVQVPPLVDLR